MYDICHPAYYNMGKLGCNNPVKLSTTFYVYLELCELKRFWDVEYKYNEKLDLLYLEARKKKDSLLEIYVPWPVTYTLTLQQIEEIQIELGIKRFTLVFKCEDSTSVSYTVYDGLAKPVAPEISKQLKEKEEKKMSLEQEIKRNTSNLFDLAKSITEQSDESASTSYQCIDNRPMDSENHTTINDQNIDIASTSTAEKT